MAYTTTIGTLENVTKKVNWFNKKAIKNGFAPCEITVGKEYLKEVPVYGYDEIQHCQTKIGKVVISVVDFELNMPTMKIGDYTLAGIVEHGDDNTNLIHEFTEVPSKYRHGSGVCEHCNKSYDRKKTAIITDGTIFKQVGISCLKEYTGIDETYIAKFRTDLTAILEDDEVNTGFTRENAPKSIFIETRKYLAECIHIIRTNGYIKGNDETATKNKAVKTNDATEDDYNTADDVIHYFRSIPSADDVTTFEWDTRWALKDDYTRMYNGFVAYAYLCFQKMIEKDKAYEKRMEDAEKSTHFGNVGDKIINMTVIGKQIALFETQFGLMRIYRFVNEDGNVFVWKTTKRLDFDASTEFTCKLSGTIKEHNEYNAEKQTVITRAKIVA